MTPTEVLTAARDLIADPDHWCQGFGAYTARGWPTDVNDSAADRWCADGALCKVSPWEPRQRARRILNEIVIGQAGVCLSSFNDSHTHGEVLAAFDRAIEAAT